MIKVNNIYKHFKLYAKPSDRLKEIFFRRSYHHYHEAIKGVSFAVAAGETLGILGKNGAGKSTLLKIITGIVLADSGECHVDGKITGLLELGTGFDENLTGIQNIQGNGLLIGMSQKEIEEQKQAIIDFSELGDYILEPLRTYSSGMRMRLAFAIAIHAKPDCFIIDEALSVGDAYFQQKCMRKIREFRAQGGSMIFVSHDLNAVKMICDKVIVLDQGELVSQGTPEEAVNYYNRIIARLDEQESSIQNARQAQNFGNKKATIESVELRGESSLSSVVSSGELTNVIVQIQAHEQIDDLSIGFMIRDRFAQDIFGTNSFLLQQTYHLIPGKPYQYIFQFPMDIAPGKYTLTVALHSQENHIDDCYHWIDNMLSFEVAGYKDKQFSGVCNLHPQLLNEFNITPVSA